MWVEVGPMSGNEMRTELTEQREEGKRKPSPPKVVLYSSIRELEPDSTFHFKYL